jgi:hypothetical protein
MTLTAGAFLALSALFLGLWWVWRGKRKPAGTTMAGMIALLLVGAGASIAVANSPPPPAVTPNQVIVGGVVVEMVSDREFEAKSMIVLVANQADLAQIRDRIDEKLAKPAAVRP